MSEESSHTPNESLDELVRALAEAHLFRAQIFKVATVFGLKTERLDIQNNHHARYLLERLQMAVSAMAGRCQQQELQIGILGTALDRSQLLEEIKLAAGSTETLYDIREGFHILYESFLRSGAVQSAEEWRKVELAKLLLKKKDVES